MIRRVNGDEHVLKKESLDDNGDSERRCLDMFRRGCSGRNELMNSFEEGVINTKAVEEQPYLKGWVLSEAQRNFLESFLKEEDETSVKEQH